MTNITLHQVQIKKATRPHTKVGVVGVTASGSYVGCNGQITTLSRDGRSLFNTGAGARRRLGDMYNVNAGMADPIYV